MPSLEIASNSAMRDIPGERERIFVDKIPDHGGKSIASWKKSTKNPARPRRNQARSNKVEVNMRAR